MKEGGHRAGLQEDGWDGSGKEAKGTIVAAEGEERGLTAGHPDWWSGRGCRGIRPAPRCTDGTLRLRQEKGPDGAHMAR